MAGTTQKWASRLPLPLVVLAVLGCARFAHAEPLIIRGEGGFEVRASRDEGELLLQGALRDDVGEAIGKQPVTVRITRDAHDDDPETKDALRSAKSCGLGTLSAQGDTLAVDTDPGGRFCVRVGLAKDRYTANLAWKGSGFLDAAELAVPFDLGRRPLFLVLDPKPRVVSLDRTPARFSALAENQENGATQAASGLGLTLFLPQGDRSPLATATTDARGRAVLDVDVRKLGAPRATTLALAFAGDADTSAAQYVVPIEVHAKVKLSAPSLEGASAKNPEDGIPIDVLAETVAGPVPEGTVEARIGDLVVGAATIELGHAHLVATFAEGGSKRLELRLRYLPQSPYFEPGPEVVLGLPVRGPSPLTRVPLAIAGALVVAWLVLGRRRAQPSARRAEAPDVRKPVERASLEVVRTSDSPKGGTYTGIVEDAHEGHPLARVRVWVEHRSFQGSETRVSVVTEDDGRFSFVLEGGLPQDTISAEGPFHAKLQNPLPVPGELRIALVTRKRKLLERLVAWARRTGAPYDARPEATPGHVKRAARDDRVATWASAVERAAFGGQEVDERAESEVEDLFPSLGDKAAAIGRVDPAKKPEPAREVQKPPKLG